MLYCGYFFDAETALYNVRELDLETGLYYYRARYYHPTLGRFITRDPMGYAARDANLYRYCANHPTNAVDPSGCGLTSLDSAIENCLKKPTTAGQVKCLETLLKICQESGYKGAKLGKLKGLVDDLGLAAQHVKKAQGFVRQLRAMKEALRTTKGKRAQDGLKKAIEQLRSEIKGHVKEVRQRWGDKVAEEIGPVP